MPASRGTFIDMQVGTVDGISEDGLKCLPWKLRPRLAHCAGMECLGIGPDAASTGLFDKLADLDVQAAVSVTDGGREDERDEFAKWQTTIPGEVSALLAEPRRNRIWNEGSKLIVGRGQGCRRVRHIFAPCQAPSQEESYITRCSLTTYNIRNRRAVVNSDARHSV